MLGLDQFQTQDQDLGQLNDIHKNLLTSNLALLWRIHPALRCVPTYVFVEANLSQDLAAFVEHSARLTLPDLQFVRQHDAQGRLLPGVLTKHKANLVSYFKRVLDEGKIAFACQMSSVSESLRARLDNIAHPPPPSQSDATKMKQELIAQLKAFKCIQKGKSTTFSGKSSGRNDDLVMALVIAVAWARLPTNTYEIKR